jgi:hypothetical protein
VAVAAAVEFTVVLQIIYGVHHIQQLEFLLVADMVLEKITQPQVLVLQILEQAEEELIMVLIVQLVQGDLELL